MSTNEQKEETIIVHGHLSLEKSADSRGANHQILTDGGVGESSNSLDTLHASPDHLQRQTDIITPGVLNNIQYRNARSYSLQSLTGTSSSSILEGDHQSSSEVSLDSDDDDKRSVASRPGQSELRKQILKIQSDPTIPASDKAKRIQVSFFHDRPQVNNQCNIGIDEPALDQQAKIRAKTG
jgi:hypothetical protein